MNNKIILQAWRFLILLLAQVLVFKQVQFSEEGWRYLHIFIYPLFTLLLPVKLQNSIVLILSFLMGFLVDWFYDSPGVHAGSLVLTAYMRPFVLNVLEPYEGYNMNEVPDLKKFGIGWFSTYLSVLLVIHLFTYFSLEAFSYVFIFDILMSTMITFAGSFIVILLVQYIFRGT